MALFGTEMIDVTTPDGRRVTMPSQLAAQFPGLTPVTPELPPSPLPPPVAAPAAPPAIPSAPQPQPLSPQDTADLEAANKPQPVAPPAPSGPKAAPAMPGGAGAGAWAPPPPATPVAQQGITNADLAKLGNAGAYNAASAALDQQGEAVKRAAQVDADEATKVGRALADRDAATQRIIEERAKVAADNQAALDARMRQYDQDAKALADIKIDRSIDHPVLAAIGVVLSGIGSAMKGESGNPGFDMLLKTLDRKVAGQMQDIEMKRGALSAQRERMGMEREAGRDRLAEIDTRRIAAIDQAAKQIETIKATSGSDRTIANADLTLAGLSMERAKILDTAGQREHAKITAEQERKDRLQIHRENLGATYAGLKQADRHWRDEMEEKKREFNVREANDIRAAEIAHAGKKGDLFAKAGKENEERGIRNIATGELLLQPEGEQLVKQSKNLEAQAEKFAEQSKAEKDPARRQAFADQAQLATQKAAELRGVATAEFAVRGRNAEQAAKLQQTIADTQSGLGLIDDINALRKKYGAKWTFSENADQQMRSKAGLLAMQVKEAYHLGALDKGSERYIERITGGDPSKLTAGDMFGFLDIAVGTEASLNALGDALEARARNDLAGSMKNPERYKFQRAKIQPEDTAIQDAFGTGPGGRTPAEQAGAEERAGSGLFDRLNYPLTPGAGPESRAKQAQESGSGRFPQFTDKQSSVVDMTLRAYNKATAAGDADAARKPAETLLALAKNSDRPAVQTAILSVLQGEAPDLYKQALAAIPEAKRRELVPPTIPGATPSAVGQLQAMAASGDQSARQELARRAQAGDADALRAIRSVLGIVDQTPVSLTPDEEWLRSPGAEGALRRFSERTR